METEKELLKGIATELRMNNIINCINNPNIFKQFLPEEQIKLLNVVKNHILESVDKTINPQTRKR